MAKRLAIKSAGFDMPAAPSSAKELGGRDLRLERGVAAMAGRLAEYIGLRAEGSGGVIAAARDFLQASFEDVAMGLSWSELAKDASEPTDSRLDPIDRFIKGLQLTALEIDLLWLAALPEHNEGYASVMRSLHPSSEPYASTGLAAQIFCRDSAERVQLRHLLASGPLTAGAVLKITGHGPFFERSLSLAEGLWSVMHGIEVWPSTISRLEDPAVEHGLEEWFQTQPVQRLMVAIAGGFDVIALVTADDEETAYQRALAVVARAMRLPVGIRLPACPDSDWCRLLQIHALARGIVPVLRPANEPGNEACMPSTFQFFPDVVVMSGKSGASPIVPKRPLIAATVERLSPSERRRMWESILPALASRASDLAARYPVEPAVAAQAAEDLALLQKIEGRQAVFADASTVIRARSGLCIKGGVKLIHPSAEWGDLVLPADQIRQLNEAVDRLAYQGLVLDQWGFLKGRRGARGVRMLFAGPPGTGKTLSAEVLANALSVDLLVVDVSRVVSKWLGETEKNLSEIFDAAERSLAVLFFDEADALFGKRTEVTDAHDRYANLETAYLLARLERFEGMAILASNLKQNIDPAFLRRLEFVIEFTDPSCKERLDLWRRHLPEKAPLSADVNLSELAAIYPVVGGFIRNAATAAGFLAAAEGKPISPNHLFHAIRREYEKSGRAFPGFPAGISV